jgi:hypothetical protein
MKTIVLHSLLSLAWETGAVVMREGQKLSVTMLVYGFDAVYPGTQANIPAFRRNTQSSSSAMKMATDNVLEKHAASS